MTKEQLHAKSKVADTRQKGQVGPGDSDMADTASVQPGTKRIPVKIEQEDEEEGQHGGNTDNAKSPRQPEAKPADRKVRARGNRQLSPEAVARLRGEAGKPSVDKGVAELMEAHEADPDTDHTAPEPDLPLKSYQAGFDQGFIQGQEHQQEVHRLQQAAESEPSSLRLWQVVAIAAVGVIGGLLVGIIL